jgi:hypothetical protein
MTLLYIGMAVVPIVQVVSRLQFALKNSALIVGTNIAGYAIYRRAKG